MEKKRRKLNKQKNSLTSKALPDKQHQLTSPYKQNEPPHDKTNKMTCAPSEDSDQPGHPPSLIRVFALHSMGS